MTKNEALSLLGGTPADAAKAIGITRQAIQQWPDVLPRTIEDRVLAALYRKDKAKQAAKRTKTVA